MVPAGNNAKRLSLVNQTTKTTHHHHHHHHHIIKEDQETPGWGEKGGRKSTSRFYGTSCIGDINQGEEIKA